jgi:pimeloyl-ACP methyl ester carboxylesterase
MHPLAEVMAGPDPFVPLSLAELLRQGKGLDCRSPEEAEVSHYARAISRQLDKCGEPACIVGWSTGGIAAIEAAANYPEKIAALVLLSATARFCAETKPSARRGRVGLRTAPPIQRLHQEYTAGVEQAVLKAMIRGLAKNPEAVIADFFSLALYPMTVPAEELARRTQDALKQGTYSLARGLEYLVRVDLRDALPSITVPCLIIHGRQDRIVPWQAALHLSSNLPVSEVEFLPSAGHSLIEQCGKEVMNRIGQFTGIFLR